VLPYQIVLICRYREGPLILWLHGSHGYIQMVVYRAYLLLVQLSSVNIDSI
jgi:hypothetical protein